MPINKPHHRPCHTPSTQNPPFLPSPLPPQTSDSLISLSAFSRATTTRAPQLRNSTAAATSSTTTTKVGDAPQLHCRFCSALLHSCTHQQRHLATETPLLCFLAFMAAAFFFSFLWFALFLMTHPSILSMRPRRQLAFLMRRR